MRGERRRTVVEDVPQARLHMVWNVPPTFDTDAARLQLATAVLAQGRDSRLDKRLVQNSLATDVAAEVVPREIGSHSS